MFFHNQHISEKVLFCIQLKLQIGDQGFPFCVSPCDQCDVTRLKNVCQVKQKLTFLICGINICILYWKTKFRMRHSSDMKEANENSLKLEEISKLLPISKIKPKENVPNARVMSQE